ncbi:alpha/beta-hydrolase [Lophium mytilinum]|uniref:Alpha/beta-hydrolase n=1 Tax=Lophium mytilinum TaxID=390894 RepID=A0A6A6QTX9_9PEZI|nr:alpha/beta-hydrolase [Lophium mytilinum]
MSIPIKKAYADTPLGQIHYRTALHPSPTKNPLILLHKSASSSACYDLLISHYSSLGHPCYAPDMPGFGNSFDPSDSDVADIHKRGTGWYVSLFMTVFQSLGLCEPGKKVHLIGHHSGAALATELAAEYPEWVSSVLLVGASVMDEAERAEMRKTYFDPFNTPVADGSHLLKTWTYLEKMGVGGDLALQQREFLDHARAWRGRMLIYGSVWDQDAVGLYMRIQAPMVVMCARDDVLWKFFGNVKALRGDVEAVECGGANFTVDRDVEGVVRTWDMLMAKGEHV